MVFIVVCFAQLLQFLYLLYDFYGLYLQLFGRDIEFIFLLLFILHRCCVIISVIFMAYFEPLF